uniref:Uncharacterized protein n=1 Tax=Quercus lobata TaxID=97700 RepID=A0A7N2RCW3_QUELO
MYVTRPLSMFQKNPSALSWPPPEGPNSGILVIEDEEAEQQYTCFGLCKSNELKDLPQTKNLTLRYSSGTGQNRRVSYFYASLIPVLNQPLSSNRYYVIKRRGSHKGAPFVTNRNSVGFVRKNAQTTSFVERGFGKLGLSHQTVGFSWCSYLNRSFSPKESFSWRRAGRLWFLAIFFSPFP